MGKLKIMCIFGTRPEAIKMAPVIRALERCEETRPVVCVTAQHREMLDQALTIFGIRAHHDLNIMKAAQTVTDITTAALEGLEAVIREEKPDMILAHGDTTTTFAAALAAFYAKIPVGHVEAGLRTYDKYQPFPEEMNRALVTRLADAHFAPTQTSRGNLLRENVSAGSIFVTGNTAVDCLRATVREGYRFKEDSLNRVDYAGKRVIAMTAHRRENLGAALRDICGAVVDIAEQNEDVEVVYAVHRNPAVRQTAEELLAGRPRVRLTGPLDLDDMHNLIHRCAFVMTDSGGLQEEAPGLHKPVLVLRNVTERPEGLAAGTLALCGTERESVARHANNLLRDHTAYDRMASAPNPFGDGRAAERIVNGILHVFGLLKERPADFGAEENKRNAVGKEATP